MNASATIRASYIRQARMSIIHETNFPLSIAETSVVTLEPRPASDEKLESFEKLDYAVHLEKTHQERDAEPQVFDVEKLAETSQAYAEACPIDWNENKSIRVRLKTMFTVFPVRDPIYLVAIMFLIGSIDLVANAFFELLPRLLPEEPKDELNEMIAVPTTVLIGSIFFFVAGIFDTFGALNADHGTLGTTKASPNKLIFRPALLGSPEFRWIQPWAKFKDLALTNIAFQAGLIVLFGGVIFMFAGIADFPGLVPESDFGDLIVFGPQVIHGLLFLIANLMLAFSEQEKWFRPKFSNADWQGAFLNSVGGAGFMMAGFFLFQGENGIGGVKAAISAMVGSWAFLIGSIIRLYVVMEFW
ncbi:hypothetical protein PTNB73_08953 [Pyrenophora teres f. teres]|uniref:Uncharacterized protein n=1 Tax=Pyrenophora teres f. teres TaxID=97479 RepID=A0A6S6WFB9_9PLEO|nr:hypothetical protein HRS9139_09176 [Pyrenophora teres f. teres]KAE8855050.1 hypothetical protein PTNB29_09301 [Pyrenophora teres f. teres]KAE8857705.1 hypothetical protein PTNB73_08953 [Pyrenophora teres f. teres]CAE7212173.1 hypothetical protein PTTW11_10265 [Pyrenophora teres f. teres]